MISCYHLFKKYDSNTILKDVTYTWEKGKCHGIIGKSGAGKTTLLRCLAGLEKPSSGKIEYDSVLSPGLVFQSYSLLQRRTALENVLLPVDLEKKSHCLFKEYAHHLLELVGLSSFKDRYPRHLSGGQRQRVAIARALILKPKILLCDELTSALDPTTTLDILELLKNLQHDLGLTILMITHDLTLIKNFADTVCLMDKGEIVESGNTVDVLTNPQTTLAKECVNHLYGTEVPEFISSFLTKKPSKYAVYRLHFNTHNASKPIVSSLIRNLHQSVNILSGRIDHINEESLGHLMISIPYDSVIADKVADFLTENQVFYECLGYLDKIDALS